MIKIGERFNVSGTYLARVCAALNVPRPERGYWAKLAVGKAPPKPPLPTPQPGDPVNWSQDGERVVAPRPQAPPRRKPERKVRIARNQVHGLLRGARSHFENGRPVDDGTYLKPYKKLLVDVTTSQASLDKTLDLANDLFNAFESVGHRVVIAPADGNLARERIDEREIATKPRDHWQYTGLWSPYRPTVVYIGTVAVGLSIVEMSENVPLRYFNGRYIRESDYAAPRSTYHVDHSWTTTRDLPSGRIRIVAYSPYARVTWSRQWQETKSSSLRGQIKAIVESIEAAVPELVTMLEEADVQAELRRQQWVAEDGRRRQEEHRRRVDKSIADSKTDLRRVIERWSDIMNIERFLADVEERALDLSGTERTTVLERLALARAFVGNHDPLEIIRGWKTPEELYPSPPGDEK
ncbi:hypothetical protein [Sphingosinicella sp. LY1275]|uniref:hypothetical protein n=1 Tax=Sphingosinicella sp. LY1275 TaxID=3095379 RepID=UPI002ADEB26F|nr:hypothetical protein [Sphingosinicella sp. LY1275]MEA1015153.1 hypothetical protein [Sphingosinicella sp. LY1275]